MMKNMLLLGDTSVPEALGSKLLRGIKSSTHKNDWNVSVLYTSPASYYSPSMEKFWGKVFYRLADKRSWEWWKFQNSLLETIKQNRPELVITTGIIPIKNNNFREIHARGGKIVNYMTDDPWNPIHRRLSFIKNLPLYDHIFCTKKKLMVKLRKFGVKSTSWLPFAFDPELHYPVETKTNCDIVFVGTGAKERVQWLSSLSNIPNIRRRIHGNSWEGINIRGWEKYPAVTGGDYCRAISAAKIVLGLLRSKNGDKSTDRSYEIGAIGGCGLYQDTDEHRSLLPTYPDAGFFSTPEELRERVIELMKNTNLQQELRIKGMKSMSEKGSTYSDRIKTIIETMNA